MVTVVKQFEHFQKLDNERKDFLVKIASLNNSIERGDKEGKHSMTLTHQNQQKDSDQKIQKDREYRHHQKVFDMR